MTELFHQLLAVGGRRGAGLEPGDDGDIDDIQHDQDQPGTRAPMNKSPTDTVLGLKMPMESWAC